MLVAGSRPGLSVRAAGPVGRYLKQERAGYLFLAENTCAAGKMRGV